MVMDKNGHSHKAAGRPDGGQYETKPGAGTDDDLEAINIRLAKTLPDLDEDTRRRLIQATLQARDTPQRVDTLIIAEPKAVRLPKITANDNTHSTAAKLGRYLLSGLDEQQRQTHDEKTWQAYADEHDLTPLDLNDDRLAHWLATNQTKGRVHAGIDNDGIVHLVSSEPWTRKWMGQSQAWMKDDKRNIRTYRRIDIPTLTCLASLNVDDQAKETVLTQQGGRDDYTPERLHEMRAKGFWNVSDKRIEKSEALQRFRTALDKRWDLETAKAANRRFSGRHSAGVFEDKLDYDDKHRQAAENSRFGRQFTHVELDNSVNLKEYAKLDREFAQMYDDHRLPRISSDNSFRFRLCGRHRAIGVYSPDAHAIAVDPRAPHSTAHEMAHAFDFEHGQLSTSEAFKPILDRQVKAVRSLDVPDTKREYLSTPTEVLARSAELYLLWTGRASSFTSETVDKLAETDPSIPSLLEQKDAIIAFFNENNLTGDA